MKWNSRRAAEVFFWACFNAKVAIYVPSTTDVNVPTDGDHFEAGLEYYRRETRPTTEAEEKEAVKYLRARNYTHFKLSKRCALKR